MPTVQFHRFYNYAELTELLRAYAAEYPDLVQCSSIGKSYEQRDIWLLTVTNQTTGPAEEKPGFWVDANIHATELAGSSAVLYLLHTLLQGYPSNSEIRRLLDTRVLYLCPRINPDGAEWALSEKPRFIRSSTRPYPQKEPYPEGLMAEDVDGDGRVLMMRLPDPHGAWKKHPTEPRLMVRREPTEEGGEYYRLLPEGRLQFEQYQAGDSVPVLRSPQGLDLNRNFPENWRPEAKQAGAGPYPTSEPEVRAVVDFFINRPNLTGGVSFHTWSGLLLRPFGDQADSELPVEDLRVYQRVGEKGTELTGYPNISVFHEFRYHPKDVITGTWDWVYSSLGLYAWTVEIWSPMREAGITDYDYIDWFRDHPVADDLKMLQWSDQALEGKGYIDWYPFNHPQLGAVELGGWNKFYAFSNPPPQFLEREIAKFPSWIIYQALLSPKLELFEATAVRVNGEEVRSVGEAGLTLWEVRFVVQNTGWLPTYVSKKCQQLQRAEPLRAEVVLPAGVRLMNGKSYQEKNQLEGRAYIQSLVHLWPASWGVEDRASFTWLVQGRAGEVVQLKAHHPQAGVVRADVVLV